MAKAQELQLRKMFAKTVVTDSDALLTSSVRIDPIAPGDDAHDADMISSAFASSFFPSSG